jgi:hypothetical protein
LHQILCQSALQKMLVKSELASATSGKTSVFNAQ